ncbi:putative integron gene cassette protein [Lysobacter antibioticus]|uniref:Putative integron gene cassette protein n=2 Tax=Lysobacter antibioticus TaxID=84531 RepID=A0A0S2FHT6_LYSAN|nr:putative integron gene cassette protein [Lysobacter antibioticus]
MLMLPATVLTLLQVTDAEDAYQAIVDDEFVDEGQPCVFWVDWREDEQDIVLYVESILRTGSLHSEVVECGSELGYEMYISLFDRREQVPLVGDVADRHHALVTLNRILHPEHEIRWCVDSDGSDTLAFVVLPNSAWMEAEEQFPDAVRRRFGKIYGRPNLFTDSPSAIRASLNLSNGP